jgi:hypothetical protein
MNIDDFRTEIKQHNADHPDFKPCIYPNCPNKIYPLWDNQVLCEEHNLMVTFWVYEKDGWKYNPDTWDAFTNKKLPKPKGSDKNMTAYRKRYCDWIASLPAVEYLTILKHQIGDETP